MYCSSGRTGLVGLTGQQIPAILLLAEYRIHHPPAANVRAGFAAVVGCRIRRPLTSASRTPWKTGTLEQPYPKFGIRTSMASAPATSRTLFRSLPGGHLGGHRVGCVLRPFTG